MGYAFQLNTLEVYVYDASKYTFASALAEVKKWLNYGDKIVKTWVTDDFRQN